MFEIFDSTPWATRLEDFMTSVLKLVRSFLALVGVEIPEE